MRLEQWEREMLESKAKLAGLGFRVLEREIEFYDGKRGAFYWAPSHELAILWLGGYLYGAEIVGRSGTRGALNG